MSPTAPKPAATAGRHGRQFAPERPVRLEGLLAEIVASVRCDLLVAKATRPPRDVERLAAGRSPRAGLFVEAISRQDRMNVIAECKERSAAGGPFRSVYDPVRIAAEYERAGAAAVSVLTEPRFFGGALDHLASVRSTVGIPVLRKDFIVDDYQLLEARAAGADAALLIAAVLDDRALASLIEKAMQLGLAVLVEAHDVEDLKRALGAGATVIGVNNRNLRTLEVDLGTCTRLADLIPADAVAVAESGIRSRDDLLRLRAMGYDAFLVGRHLMSSADPTAALADLTGVPIGPEQRREPVS